MVERLLCKQDVSGSSPLTSTKKKRRRHSKVTNTESKVRLLEVLQRRTNLENCIKSRASSKQLLAKEPRATENQVKSPTKATSRTSD